MADSWEDDDFEPVVLNTAAPPTAPAAVTAAAVSAAPAPLSVAAAGGDESDGDDWENDDFDAPVLLNKAVASVQREEEEEEDLVYEELNKKEMAKGAPTKVTEELARKQAAEEAALLLKARNGGVEETAEQRRLRERKQQEDADIAQAADAFSGFTVDPGALEKKKESTTPQAFEALTKGIGAVLLKTKQDHVNFGANTQLKLRASKPEHIVAFYVAVLEVLKGNTFTLQLLTPIHDEIKKAYDLQVKKEKRSNIVPVRKTAKAEKAGDNAANGGLDDGDFYGDDDDGFGDDLGYSGGSSAVKGKNAVESEEEAEARCDAALCEQHAHYGNAVVLKFARSTAQNVSAFFTALSALLTQTEMDSLLLGDVLNAMQAIHSAREKVEAKTPKVKTEKDAKREKAAQQQRMKEIFGDSTFDDSYGDYTSMEDKYSAARDELW